MAKSVTSEASPTQESAKGERSDAGIEYEGVLADVIEVERRARAAVEDAEAEAARAIAEAEVELHARAEAHDDALDAARRELRSTLEQEQKAGLAEIERRSEEAVRRHRDVDEARVLALAGLVARRVAEGDPGEHDP
jgi:hypothetical protein